MNTFITVLEAGVDFHKPFDSVSEALAYGIPSSLVGFATVFAVLFLLWGVVALMKVFFYTIPNRKNADNADKKSNAKVIEEKNTVIETPANSTVVTATANDNEIVAAIIAAIEAYRAQNGNTSGFRVVSFKKRK